MTKSIDINLLKNTSLFKAKKHSISMHQKGYFESLRKKAKAKDDDQLIGYTAERGLFGRIKETPLLMSESEVEKGVLLSGSGGSGLSETKNIWIYNQIKKGMGGLILSSLDSVHGIHKIAQMMQETERKDMVLINGIDERQNREVWDFFKNGTTEEIIAYFTMYLEDTYEKNIVDKIKPLVKKYFEYYAAKKIELTIDNIHEYVDFNNKRNEETRKAYPAKGRANKLDRDFVEWLRKDDNGSTELLQTTKALLMDAIGEIKIFCDGFKFTKDEMDFKRNIVENKVIYACGPCNYKSPVHGKIFEILIVERYLKALNELEEESVAKLSHQEGKSNFFVYSSDVSKKSNREINFLESAINNKYLYTLYASRCLEDECRNEKLLKILKSFSTKVLMKNQDPDAILRLLLNSRKMICMRDIVNQGPGDAHLFFDDKVERIKSAYFSAPEINNLTDFIGNTED